MVFGGLEFERHFRLSGGRSAACRLRSLLVELKNNPEGWIERERRIESPATVLFEKTLDGKRRALFAEPFDNGWRERLDGDRSMDGKVAAALVIGAAVKRAFFRVGVFA